MAATCLEDLIDVTLNADSLCDVGAPIKEHAADQDGVLKDSACTDGTVSYSCTCMSFEHDKECYTVR